jgi:hypothetical protein
MTTEQKTKYSRILIILGVLAWLPYIIARLLKVDLSAIPFLILHLIGVLGGVLLRRNTEAGTNGEASRQIIFLKKFSTVILILGVSVWGVYFGLQWITGVSREVTPFLIAHLSGVLTGAAIKLYIFFSRS